jgi:hypothetical protein
MKHEARSHPKIAIFRRPSFGGELRHYERFMPKFPRRLPPYAEHTDPEDFDPMQAPPQAQGAAVRFQDSAFFYTVPPFILAAGIWYPVAEFFVAGGEWGQCYKIETHVYSGAVRNIDNDPLAVQRAANTGSVYFRLMLQRSNVAAQPHGWTALPGVPNPGISFWGDGRYCWGHDHPPLAIFVPEDRYLRLYVGLTPNLDPVPTEIGGRLLGMAATYQDNPQAILKVRTG